MRIKSFGFHKHPIWAKLSLAPTHLPKQWKVFSLHMSTSHQLVVISHRWEHTRRLEITIHFFSTWSVLLSGCVTLGCDYWKTQRDFSENASATGASEFHYEFGYMSEDAVFMHCRIVINQKCESRLKFSWALYTWPGINTKKRVSLLSTLNCRTFSTGTRTSFFVFKDI